MRFFNVIALSASIFAIGSVQAQTVASDLEQKCVHIEQSIDHINTADQPVECQDQLLLAYANANEAEMSIHFHRYVTAHAYLIDVLNEMGTSIALSCKHLDDIVKVHNETVALINALPDNN